MNLSEVKRLVNNALAMPMPERILKHNLAKIASLIKRTEVQSDRSRKPVRLTDSFKLGKATENYFKTERQETAAKIMVSLLPFIDWPGSEIIYQHCWHWAEGYGFDRVEAYLLFHGASIDTDIPEADLEALFKECQAYDWLALDKKEELKQNEVIK